MIAQAPLMDLVEGGAISYGVVQPGSDGADGVPIVRVGDLESGSLGAITPQMRVDPVIEARFRKTRLRGGEVLVSLVGSAGRAAVVPSALAGWNVARAVAVVRPKGVAPEWLMYSLRSSACQNQISAALNTTVQATLNLSDLKKVLIPMPPEVIRRNIVEVLGALDDKIAANHRLQDSIDQFATALVERETAGSAPLGDISTVVMGTSPRGDAMNEIGEGIEFFQGVRDFGFRVPASRVFTTSPVKLAEAGDLLVSVRAPVGRINRADRSLCIGRGLAAVRSKTGSPGLLFHALVAAKSAWEPFNHEGTVFGSINGSDIRRIEIPWVATDVVAGLEARISPLEQRIDQSVDESTRLATLRDTLLPHLMSGRITVREAEERVEEVV